MSHSLRERARRLLARREHARGELARKLMPHADSEEELTCVLEDLAARGLLSDERYVEMRLHARAARFGNARLKHELRQQGVDETVVQAALADADDELARAHAVWQGRYGAQAEAPDAAERARQMRFLMSRGFSAETIRRVLRGDFEID